MSTTLHPPIRARPATARPQTEAPSTRSDPRYQAYVILRAGFTLLPLVVGIDKFFDVLTEWSRYLAGWIDNIVPGSAEQFMYGVGVVEIIAAGLVAIRPRIGAYVVAAWLAGIVVNLVSYGEWYDIALRDFGLMLAALAFARLAKIYDRPMRSAAS